MYNKFGFKKSPPVSKPGSENFSRRREIQPSITKLTRESLRYLPRESLAWLTQLPRESATFAELQKMMTDSDKNLMDDDDTDSFEALESRLKTPYKKRPSPLLEEKKKEENNENHDESGIEPINESVVEAVPGEEEEDVVEVQKVVEEQMVQELVQEEEQEEYKEEQEEQKEQEEQEEQEEQKEEVEAAPATPVSEATCVPLSVPRTPLVKSASNSDISRTPLVEVPLGERRSQALS